MGGPVISRADVLAVAPGGTNIAAASRLVTPVWAAITAATAANTIVAAPTNDTKVRVLGYYTIAATGASVTWQTVLGTAVTALSGTMVLANGQVFADGPDPGGVIEGTVNGALRLAFTSGTAGPVTGYIKYILVP